MMMKGFVKFQISMATALLAIFCFSCSNEADIRQPEDILGVWQKNADSYVQFLDDNIANPFTIEYQDGQSIGKWGWEEVYYYEPGYNLVVYLTSTHEADVYQIIELSKTKMTWCKVDEIKATDAESISKIIGEIINKAQDGYELNPELYQSFLKISEVSFLELLESLDAVYDPWEWDQ